MNNTIFVYIIYIYIYASPPQNLPFARFYWYLQCFQCVAQDKFGFWCLMKKQLLPAKIKKTKKNNNKNHGKPKKQNF